MDEQSALSLLQDIVALSKNVSTNAILRLERSNSFSPQSLNIMLEAEARLKAVSSEFLILMNAWRPVSHVPAEILAHIFSFVGCGTIMLPISCVCQRWRQVALATSSLWTRYKSFREREWLPILLDRSASRPLDVEIVVPSRIGVPSRFIEPLSALEGRADSLVLWIARSKAWREGFSHEILDAFRKCVFPTLTSLTVIDSQIVHEPLDEPWFGNISEAEPLQSLRYLCLHHIAFKKLRTGLELCTHLQTVVLWNVKIVLLNLLGLVCGLNNLEVLALIQLDVVTGLDFSIIAHIMRPSRLRFLRLDAQLGDPSASLDTYHLLNLMLRDFRHPELVGRYLDLEDTFEDRQARTESPERTIDGVHMLSVEEYRDHVAFRASDGVSFYKFNWLSSQIHNVITPDGLLLDSTLCRLTGITQLSIMLDLWCSYNPDIQWSTLFSVMPFLEVLRCSERLHRLKRIFTALTYDNAEDTAVVPCAVHLKEIAIKCLSDRYNDCNPKVEAFLKQRAANGHPIQRLELMDGKESRHFADPGKFQPYVQTVVILQEWPYGKIPVPEHFPGQGIDGEGVTQWHSEMYSRHWDLFDDRGYW